MKKRLLKPKKSESHSAEKVDRGTLLLWNSFVFHVRDFGCVQNQVPNTYGKSAHSAQKVDIQSEADKKN